MDRPTVDLYEAQSETYAARRAPTDLGLAVAVGARRPSGVVVDLGSGPGWYTGALGHPVVALDAAMAMLKLTRQAAPDAWAVQGDLAALPFRRGALAAAWARNSYVHLHAADVPLALADLHHALAPEATVELTFFAGEAEGRAIFPDDDFPGRWFSTWSAEHLADVVRGAGFGLDELQVRSGTDGAYGYRVRATRHRALPDFVGPEMRLLLCGLNPSLHAADAGVGFITTGNRFWPAARAAGLVSRDRDPRHALHKHGMGMTDLVKRPTPRADALTRAEYIEGHDRLDRLCAWLQPRAVGVVGLAGWRAAVDRKATAGWQTQTLGGRPVYLLPSTSGLNAGTSLAVLIDHLRAAVASA